MGAGGAPVGTCGDVERSRRNTSGSPSCRPGRARRTAARASTSSVVVATAIAEPRELDRARARREAPSRAAFALRPVSSCEVARRARPRPLAPAPRAREARSRARSCRLESTEHGSLVAHGGVVEQALVDVADLLDVERAEAERRALRCRAGTLHLEQLERVEHVQHGAVVDRQRTGGRARASGAVRAPFEEREAVGVEEARRRRPGRRSGSCSTPPWTARKVASSRGQASWRRSRTSSPCAVGLLAQLRAQRGDGVAVVPEVVAEQEAGRAPRRRRGRRAASSTVSAAS